MTVLGPERRRTPGVLAVLALTVAVNLLLGYLSLLPAMYAAYTVSDLFGVPPYVSDPGFLRAIGFVGMGLVVGEIVAVNALLQRFLPGRPWWIWPVALAAYPWAFLVEIWPRR